MTPQPGGEQVLALRIDRHAAGNKSFELASHAKPPMMGEQAVVEIPGMDDFLFAAAGKQPFAIRRKAQTVKRLIDFYPANDLLGIAWKCDDDNFMSPVASMEDSEPMAAGMQGHVNRKIAERQLLAGWPQRPLVGQANHSIRLQPRQHACSPSRIGTYTFLAPFSMESCRKSRKARSQSKSKTSNSNQKHGCSDRAVVHPILHK